MAVPFCSEIGKTAFPVRSLIEWLNITDSHQKDLVYQFADVLLRKMQGREFPALHQGPDNELHPLAQAILAAFGADFAQMLADHLVTNLNRSLAFERDVARVDNNLLRSLPHDPEGLVRKVQLMTYVQRQWSHAHALLILLT